MSRNSSIKVGDKFGRLTVEKLTKFKYFSGRVWKCRCECGNTAVVPASQLTTGNTVSCGCLKKEWASVRSLFNNHPHSATGYKGVYYNQATGKYMAIIINEGIRYNLGSYKRLTDAVKARRRAEEEYHFPRMEAYENMRVGA